MKKKELRPKLSRSDRLSRKFKGVLRCEWCNRWTICSMAYWHKLRKEDALFPAKYQFRCQRERCRAERMEILGEVGEQFPRGPSWAKDTPS